MATSEVGEKQVLEQLAAYREAGWDEATSEDIFSELIALSPTSSTATVLGIREMRRDVEEFALELWRGVRDQLMEQLKGMDRQQLEMMLISYVIKHSGEIVNLFFSRRAPSSEQISAVVALLVLYLLQRYKRWEERQQRAAS